MGKREAVTIYEPVGRREQVGQTVLDELEDYHRALGHYRARAWDRAQADFERLSTASPGYRPYQIYLERITRFKQAPPDESWDCTHIWEEK